MFKRLHVLLFLNRYWFMVRSHRRRVGSQVLHPVGLYTHITKAGRDPLVKTPFLVRAVPEIILGGPQALFCPVGGGCFVDNASEGWRVTCPGGQGIFDP